MILTGVCIPSVNKCICIKVSVMCVLIKSDIHCQLSLLNVAMLHSPMIIVVLDKNEIFLMCVKLPFADVC